MGERRISGVFRGELLEDMFPGVFSGLSQITSRALFNSRGTYEYRDNLFSLKTCRQELGPIGSKVPSRFSPLT